VKVRRKVSQGNKSQSKLREKEKLLLLSLELPFYYITDMAVFSLLFHTLKGKNKFSGKRNVVLQCN